MSDEPGRVTAATTAWLAALDGASAPLQAIALALAEAIDGGGLVDCPSCEVQVRVPSSQLAPTAKELRATLADLTPKDGGDAFTELLEQLSS